MRRRISISFILLVLFSFCILAQQITPSIVSFANITITQTGTVESIGGTMHDLDLRVAIPGDFVYQNTLYNGMTKSDSEGNTFAWIFIESPGNPYHYGVTANVISSDRNTTSLPSAYSVPSELAQYAMPSDGIESDDPQITALARNITQHAASDWEKVALLTDFVHNYVTYDSSVTGELNSALWVLRNKRGVCVEYGNLYAALARSIGIPTKIDSGYAYGGDLGWQGHVWAESYIGEWVPVDPTWNEAGHLDATHIQVSSTLANFVDNQVEAQVSHGAHLSITSDHGLGSSMQGITANSLVEADPIDFELSAGASSISFGDETIIYGIFNSSDYRMEEISLLPCSQSNGEYPAQILDGSDRLVLFEPGVEKIVSWHVRANPNLDSGYLWTCPFTINSDHFEQKKINLTFSSGSPSIALAYASLERNNVVLGENETVYYEAHPAYVGTKVGVITEDGVFFLSVSPGQHAFSFRPTQKGENNVTVFSGRGGVLSLSFNVISSSAAHIESFDSPEFAVVGKAFNVSVFATSTNLQQFLMNLSLAGDSFAENVSVDSSSNLSFSLVPQRAGTERLSIVLSQNGTDETVTKFIKVRPQPNVFASVDYDYNSSANLTYVLLDIVRLNDPASAKVSLCGNAISVIDLNQTTFSCSPGNRTMLVEWTDALGNGYNYTQELSVPSPPASPFGICGFPAGFAVGCMAIFLFLRAGLFKQ